MLENNKEQFERNNGENVLIEYNGRCFKLSQNLLNKYKIDRSGAKSAAKRPANTRWYELGESDCY